MKYNWARYSNNSYEVSSKGDKRFSAFYAKLSNGKSIEETYQLDLKGYRKITNNLKDAKGKPPLINISKEELWRQYLEENPYLFHELKEKAKDKVLTDMFAKTNISQARALCEILNELINE